MTELTNSSLEVRRSPVEKLLNVGLTILAVFGTVCIALVIIAFVFNFSIILFKTGSMEPAIPQGSAALAREIPASDIRVGDVVTVDRGSDERPITHRVTEIRREGDAHYLIAMRGDANPRPDPAMYRVSEVRKVLWHVPGAAVWIVWLSSPLLLIAIVLAAAFLVGWAFWPDPEDDEGPPPTESAPPTPDDREVVPV